jgi:hypothetical protein
MAIVSFYPPVKGLTYRWFIYRNSGAPHTATVLEGERPATEADAAKRIEQLAREQPGETFGYGFSTPESPQANTAVSECRYIDGVFRLSSRIADIAA